MKITVLGAGVIGVTTAYFLARQGHEVEVIDRQSGPALETSHANAGEISPGYASPWAAPGIPLKAAKWLLQKHAPLAISPTADPFQYRWMLQMLRNCTHKRYAVNKGRMVRLAEYSRDVLIALRAETGIEYDARQQGTLQVFRTQKQLDHAADDIAVLRASGVPHEVLDRAGCVAAEPGLAASAEKLVGGLRLPGDETGDCFKFTTRLAAMAEKLGVRFRFDTQIERILTEGGKVSGVTIRKGDVIETAKADRFVLALGSYSRALGRQVGLDLPVYPVKGYSITLAITDAARAPVSTVMDESYKIAITRLGERIRVGGMAELAGFSHTLKEARKQTLLLSVTDLFPDAADTGETGFWTGLRPMTPDGTPIIGASKLSNLFLNTGHGTLGWTMACGSARLLADSLSGQAPEIESADLSAGRYAMAA